ncbi:MAG: Rrf2 family transcriptional regulator [Betaproteobacteria bacterium]|nr:Rrf2 family transcriptional regulator [Betaproteobacteria bacterium]
MLLSRSTQYTLQALLYLTRKGPERRVLVREIADEMGLPVFYLAKLLQPPTRAGWLTAVRGRGGGVHLNPGAENVTLFDILQLSESHRISRECLLGFKTCEDDSACVLHCEWKPIKQELSEGLGRNSLATLAQSALPSWLLGDGKGGKR